MGQAVATASQIREQLHNLLGPKVMNSFFKGFAKYKNHFRVYVFQRLEPLFRFMLRTNINPKACTCWHHFIWPISQTTTENHIVILISSQKLRSHGMHVNFATTIFRHKGAPLFCYHTTRHKRVSPPILPHLPGHKKERPSILLHIPLDTRGEASHSPKTIRYKKGPPILLRPRLKQKGDSTIYTRRFPLFRYASLLTQAGAAPPMSAHPSSDIRVSPPPILLQPSGRKAGVNLFTSPPL